MSELLLDPEEVDRWWTEARDDPRRMAEIAIRALRERASYGDVNAEAVLWDWQMAGAIQRLKRTRQGLRQVITPKGTGNAGNGQATLPVGMSIPRADGSHQMVLWATLTLVDFTVYVAEYRAHTHTRTNVLRSLERILTVWSEHPDVLGDEALRLAGIDPSALVVEPAA